MLLLPAPRCLGVATDTTPRFVIHDRDPVFGHVIVRAQVHLARLLHAYQDNYNNDRTHLALAKDCPVPRPVQPSPTSATPLDAKPKLGDLHHRYDWAVG